MNIVARALFGDRTRPRVLPPAPPPAASLLIKNLWRDAFQHVRRGRRTRHARRVRSPEWIAKTLRAFVFLSTFVAAIWLALPRPPLLDGISFSQSVRDRSGKLLRVTLSADQKFRVWTPLRDISPELIDATLQYRR